MKHYIGLMSGTSLDGVDGVLVARVDDGVGGLRMLASSYHAFDHELRAGAMALQTPGENEIHREAVMANLLATHYAACVAKLLRATGLPATAVSAIGAHGQTIRHRPEQGYTHQTNNPALLVELTGIDVIADFRRRDVAAGGQGAPLVPAFHEAMFGRSDESRVIANIGGISNITIIGGNTGAEVTGFDTGPGNMLMDAWIQRHRSAPYDAHGAWAATGTVHPPLLDVLRNDPYFAKPAPKSTGRDLFGPAWLDARLPHFTWLPPADVQATLLALTATTLADAIAEAAPAALAVYVCGGGAFNLRLMDQIEQALRKLGHPALVTSTAALGVSPSHVEALAFAWLAECFDRRQPGNLPRVTGARGPRVLGALYPAGPAGFAERE
ncbi:MAG: anhydro-N-acetylmuramic acid kinase [Burkholderiaceae bacterium]